MSTAHGKVCGGEVTIDYGPNKPAKAHAFLGIPYGKSERWSNPKPADSWSGTFPATQYGQLCPQQCGKKGKGVEGSEDCLTINVWTPAPFKGDAKLPVMVYIYGGAFVAGGSTIPDTFGRDAKAGPGNLYDGSFISSAHNVVVVSFNYRLGVLGFLVPFDSSDENDGNYGFKDQQLALQWVQENIENFGGDKTKVTIFGESAGAMSVALHMLSAESSYGGNLFRAGIMQSNLPGLPYEKISDARARSKKWANKRPLKCSDMSCLKEQSCHDLVANQKHTGLPKGLTEVLEWKPVIDGDLIAKDPLEGQFKQPAIMGTNLNEGVLFASGLMESFPLGKFEFDSTIKGLFPEGSADAILAKGSPYRPERCKVGRAGRPCRFGNGQKLAELITDYMFTCANQKLAKQQRNKDNLYLYSFQQYAERYLVPLKGECPQFEEDLAEQLLCSCFSRGGPSGDLNAVCHAAELPYVFNSAALYQDYRSGQRLGQQMAGYWTQFATTHPASPNGRGSGSPEWAPFSRAESYHTFTMGGTAPPPDPLRNCEFLKTKVGYPPQ